MTKEERELALYCLKASSDYHSEVCEECINYPNCDHTIQDDVTETIIKALEQEPCEDCRRKTMTDREQAIKTLEDIIATAEGLKGLPSQYGGIIISLDKIDSLKFALESIKVDRAYDLAYEKVDFIEIPEGTTNGDMIKAMFPSEVGYGESTSCIYYGTMRFDRDWWNSPYRKEQVNESKYMWSITQGS